MDNGTLIGFMAFGGSLAASIAGFKGRNFVGWALGGACFPLIAAVVLLCLPPVRQPMPGYSR